MDDEAADPRTPLPPKPIYGAWPVGDPLLDAAALCVERKGFDNTSLEEVAVEAGVSRTTLYRRFGNREALFSALLFARSAPFRRWAREVLCGTGSVAMRLETVIVHATLELQRVGWLDETLRESISPLGSRLLKTVHKQGAEDGIGLLVGQAMASRAAVSEPITRDEVLDWLMEQMIAFARMRRWEEDELRTRVRYFVIPVLVGEQGDDRASRRLEAIEGKLDRLLART